MIRFIVKRFFVCVPIVFLLSFLTLVLINLVPGSYFDQLRLNPQIGAEIIHEYETRFHINENVCVQYFYWLKNVLRLDFGYSFTYQVPVTRIISSRLLNTFLLSFVSFVFSWCIALPLGLIAAYYKDSSLDKGLRFCAYVLLSLPGFFFALLLMWACAQWTALPIGGMHSVDFDMLSFGGKCRDLAVHMVVPVVALSSFSASYLFRLMRSNTLEVLGMDFVRVLHTRGLSARVVVFKHVFRNASNPLVTLLGFQLPALFSGAALIEIITGWPGLGAMMLFAVRSQDVFLVMGNMLMISLLLIAGNVCADVMLAMADPRIRY